MIDSWNPISLGIVVYGRDLSLARLLLGLAVDVLDLCDDFFICQLCFNTREGD
jgi:hypothetical protein